MPSEKKWNWFSLAVALSFSLMQNVFRFLISCFLISCWFLVLVYFIADVPAANRVRRSINTVCDACGKYSQLPMDLKSIEPSDIWSARHATFLMMDSPVHTWCPQHEWRCPLPCWKSWRRRDENTVPLRKQKSTYGAYFAYLIYIYLGSNSRRGSDTTPPGVGRTVLIKLIILIMTYIKNYK